jgi:hypothetical protein
MWGIITGGITSIVKEGFAYFTAKQKAKTAVQERIIAGEMDYNVAAQHGMASSWKDEWLTIWTTLLVTAHFIPNIKLQASLKMGWTNLAQVAPDWFGYCFVGMYVAIFGLKGWKIFKS